MPKQTAEQPEIRKEKAQYVTQKQIAEILEVTEFEIKSFIRTGFPKAGHNKFILKDCIKWYINYLKWKNEHWSVDDIATVCGVTSRTIQNWVIKNNIPKKERGAYNVRSTILAWINSINENHENLSGEKTLNRSRQRLIDMQADVKEMDLLEKQKKLIPIELASKLITDLAAIVDKKLDLIEGYPLNELFACRTKEETLKVLKETKHHIKTEISKEQYKQKS